MKCPNCGETKFIKYLVNGTAMDKCFKCGVFMEAKQEPKNKSEKYGNVVMISSWKSKD